MPTRAPRPCRRNGCSALVIARDGWCDEHRKETQKDYNENYRPSHHKLYRTQRWRDLRDTQLYAEPHCMECGAPATVAHHVVEHFGDPRLFYDGDNLMSLCYRCHARVHSRGTDGGGGGSNVPE